MAAVIPFTVPVKVGDANGANKFNAACVAVLLGRFAGAKFWTLFKQTEELVSPFVVAEVKSTVPVSGRS